MFRDKSTPSTDVAIRRSPLPKSRLPGRLAAATALAGLAMVLPAAASDTSGIYFTSSCYGTGSCNYFVAPTLVGVGGVVASTGTPTLTLDGAGAAMKATVVDTSFASILASTDPTSDRTTLSAMVTYFRQLTGTSPQLSGVAPFSDLVAVATDGSMAKADIMAAQSAWNRVRNLTSGVSSTIDATSLVSGLTTTELKSMLQPELAALTVAADGTVSASAAQFAVAQILYRSLQVADVIARGNKDFYDQLLALDAADGKTDGIVSISDVVAAMGFASLPADKRAYYEASLARLELLLAGHEQGTGLYRIDDLFLAAEADGSAYETVYGSTGNTLSTVTSVALTSVVDWSKGSGTLFHSNVTSLYTTDAQTLLGSGTQSVDTVNLALAKIFAAAKTEPAMASGSVTVTDGVGILATNTSGSIDLTNHVGVTATGTKSATGVLAQSQSGPVTLANDATVTATAPGATGVSGWTNTGNAVSVVNSGKVTVTGDHSNGVSAVIETGSGTATALNKGEITASGTNARALTAHTEGTASVSATNEGTLTATGTSAAGIQVWSQSGTATATNAVGGTITVSGEGSEGITSYAESGGKAVSTNAGVVEVRGGNIGVGAGSANGTAEVSNTGRITLVSGTQTGDLLVALGAGADTGTASVTNDGTLVASGPGVSGMGAIASASGGSVSLTNNGSISADGTSAYGVRASTVDGTLTAKNTGTISVEGGEVYGLRLTTGTGTISATNEGRIEVSATEGEGISAASSGGNVTVENLAAGVVKVDADLNATGLLAYVMSGSGDAKATSAGSVEAKGLSAGGIVAIAASGKAEAGNSGTVTVTDGDVGVAAVSASGAASATNSGKISLTTDGTVKGNEHAVALGAITDSGTASVTNDGTLVASGPGAAGMGAIATASGGSVSLTNNGSISTDGTSAYGMRASTVDGSIDAENLGTITVDGGVAYGILLATETGAVSASNGGRIEVSATGGAGISATSTGGSVTIENLAAGVVKVQAAKNANGLFAFVDSGDGLAKVKSAGTVEASGTGTTGILAMAAAGKAESVNSGTVTVTDGDAGVAAVTSSGAASATNSGTITLTTDGNLKGNWDAVGLAAVTDTGTATATNTGSVTASGALAKGAMAIATAAGGTVTVTNEGTLSATGDGAIGLLARTAGGTASITNLGTIDASGTDAIGLAVVTNGGKATVVNAGKITGGVALESGNDEFTNSGTVVGSIDLGAGDDLFVNQIGGAFGKLEGGTGTDTFDFRSKAGEVGVIDAASVTGFEIGRLSGGADWRIVGDMPTVALSVETGALEFAGTLGSVRLTSSSLMGSGTVASLTSTGGLVAPGDTLTTSGLGTISVTGDLTLDNESIVLLDLAGTASDKIVVGGTATLGGAGLLLRGRDLVGGTTFQVLTAGTSVDGTFASTVNWTDGNWDFLGLTVEYDANSVTLRTADSVTQAKAGMTPESQTFLDSVFGTTPQLITDEQTEAYREIGQQIAAAQGSSSQIQQTMDEVDGKAIVVAANAATSAVKAVDQAVSRAGEAAVGGGSPEANGVTLAYLDDEPTIPAQRAIGRVLSAYAKPPVGHSLVAWTTGQFGFGRATSGTSSSDFRSGGVTVGIIKRIDEAFSVGFAGGYTRSNVDVRNPTAHLGVDSYHLLAHGTWETDAFRFNGLVGYAFQDFKGRRNVISSIATSDYDGGSVRFGVDAGYKIKWQTSEFMPFVGLDVIHGWTSGYTEKGAGVLDLTVEDARNTSVDGRVGLKWSAKYAAGPGTTITPMLSAAWLHSFGDMTSTVHASMVGSSFVMTGPSRSRDALAISTGLTADVGDGFSIFGRYSGRLASDLQAHDFSAGLRYKW